MIEELGKHDPEAEVMVWTSGPLEPAVYVDKFEDPERNAVYISEGP